MSTFDNNLMTRHQAWLRNATNGKRLYLSGANLSDAILRDADLRGANLSDAYLRGANLSDADLRGAYLRDANLSDAILRGADLNGAILNDADLRGAILNGAILSGADLRRADLNGAILSDAILRRADLRDADLSGADLNGAILNDADLRGAILNGAILSGADLRRADLNGANLSGTCLDPAAALPGISDIDITAAGLEILGDQVWGWRTEHSMCCGSGHYTPGEHVAPVFSVDVETECHPGIYIAARDWLIRNYGNAPHVRCYCLRSELLHVGDKWRAKRIWVVP